MRTSNIDRERSNSCVSNGSGGSLGGASLGTTTNRPHSGCDIVKAGYLHIKRPPTNGTVKLRIKTWQKRYLVLRDQSYDSGTARLDIFTTESEWLESDLTGAECYSIDLRTVSHVDEYTESKSYPNAFIISRNGHAPLVLGAETEFEAKEWIVALELLTDKLKSDRVISGSSFLAKPDPNRRPSCPSRLSHWSSAGQLHTTDVFNNNNNNNDVTTKNVIPCRIRINSQSNIRLLKLPSSIPACKDCLVTVQSTEAAKRNRLSGEYNMIIQDSDIVLRRPNEVNDVIKWSIGNIRKLKSEDLSDGWNLITLDANVCCGSRSGTFLFRTAFGRKLIEKVKDSLRQQASNVQYSEKNLDKLRSRSLSKAPSTPNLTNRGSPPKLVTSKNSNIVPVKERTPSKLEDDTKPKSYLELLPEEQRDPSIDSGDYVDDQIVQESITHSVMAQSKEGCREAGKRPSSGLPPLPPPNITIATVSPPPSVSSPSSSSASSLSSSECEPPELPPRRPSCTPSSTPPSPPPRPQHTLSTNSLPVSNVRP